MKELFRLLGIVAIENDEAKKALDDTSKDANETKNSVSNAFTSIGKASIAVGKVLATSAAAIGGSFLAVVESTREYRTEMGKLDTAFQTNGHSSEAAKQAYSDLHAVLGDSAQAVEAANHLAVLTDNEKDLQTWTDICAGVYATFGASLPIEGLTEAANETAKTGVLTGSLTDAINWAGIGEEEFQKKLDSCNNEQERQKLIMDTLNGTYKNASEQYKETNKDILDANRANEKLTDAFSKLGAVGEPIVTAIKEKIADMVSAAVPLLESFIQKVKDIKTWIQDNQNTINNWIAVIIGASAAIGTFLLILNWSNIMTAAVKAVNLVRNAIVLFNAVLLANPIGLVVAAIVGLVAAFVYLWNTSDSFRQFWIDLWNKVKKYASDAWKAISKAFSDGWKKAKEAWQGAKAWFQGVWNGVKAVFSSVGTWFSSTFKKGWNGAKNAFSAAKSWFSGIWSGIKGVFGSVGSWFSSTFKKAWSNIKSAFSNWGSFFSGLWTKIKNKFGSIGSSLGKAMGDAVKSGMNSVISLIEKSINKGIGLINSAITLANKLPAVNVGKLSKVSLPRLEKGGVLEKGQIGFLEGSGAEAVVPLENNRKWISAVAEDMNKLKSSERESDANYSKIIEQLNRIARLLESIKKMNIYLDSGALVGELTPSIDVQMSNRLAHIRRGNTR